jgi:hypothetical protein
MSTRKIKLLRKLLKDYDSSLLDSVDNIGLNSVE